MILHSESDNRGGGRMNISYGRDFEPLPEYPHSPLACLIGHEALFEGEVMEPTPGYTYSGMDDRGLPVLFQTESLCEEWESWQLEGVLA